MRRATVQAGHVFALVKQFFGFALDRGDIDFNPADRLRNQRALGVEKNVSQRFLSNDEIVAFWVAHQKLTRQREKTSRPWIVPLPPAALTILRELEVLAKALGSPHVLASFHATAKGAALTEKALNHAMRRLFTGKKPVLVFQGERPTPHDLRRTLRTHLGDKLRVSWHIAERCLNHSLGTNTAVYDVADYLEERREALTKWDEYVQGHGSRSWTSSPACSSGSWNWRARKARLQPAWRRSRNGSRRAGSTWAPR